MSMMDQDYSEVARLDDHFADLRAQQLALEAEAQRTQHAATMAGLRNERIRRIGLAALPIGAGVGLALFGASFLLAGHERVVYTPGPVVTRDVPGPERFVYRDPPAPAPAPLIAQAPLPPHRPVAETPLAPPYAPRTPEEKPFTEKPEYKSATYHGRIIHSVDGRNLSFADGQNVFPAHWDDVNSKVVEDKDRAYDSEQYVGDLGMCTIDTKGFWLCTALHDGKEVPIYHKPKTASVPSSTPATANMVNVWVDVGDYPVYALVDTGCSWPLSIPSTLADALIKRNLASSIGVSKSILADGNEHDGNVIMINSITVEGHTLHHVEAVVSPNQTAPILLGLGALNQLGPYSIVDGKIVFTS
jgi:hypothetical protein